MVDLGPIKDPEVRFRCGWYVKCIEHRWFKRFGIVHMRIDDWIDKDHFTAIYPPSIEWPVPIYGDATPDMYGMGLSDEEKSTLIGILHSQRFLSDTAPPFKLEYDSEQETFIYATPNDYAQLYADYLSQGDLDKRSALKPRSIH